MASTNTRLSTLGDRGCKSRDDMVEKENNEDRGAHGHRHSMAIRRPICSNRFRRHTDPPNEYYANPDPVIIAVAIQRTTDN